MHRNMMCSVVNLLSVPKHAKQNGGMFTDNGLAIVYTYAYLASIASL